MVQRCGTECPQFSDPVDKGKNMDAMMALEQAVKGFEVPQKRKALRLDQCYEKSPGLLYFILMEGPEQFVKIGIASSVMTRLSTLQVCCPYPVRVLKVVDGAWHLERSLHKRFAHLHARGEWFRLEGELAELIERLP